MITQALYDKFFYFTTLRRFTNQDALEMQAAIRQTFNPTFVLCTYCPSQIQHAQKMITNYLKEQVVMEDIKLMVDSEETLLKFDPVELSVDIVEADKVNCTKCNRRKKNKG